MTEGSDENEVRAVELSIRSDPRNLAVVRAAAEKMARQEGFAPSDVDGIVLAMDEALANVMKHGYEGRKNCEICIRLEAVCQEGHPAGLQVILRDRGKQVDPGQIRGRDLDDVRPGGLGVHIIQTVMDHVEYRCLDGGGMELRMVKYVKGQGGPPS
ncbi:MAG: ATP-binding protein [Phycisphaerae bacterium]|nr:ATP-binding protein [Phycisphaerae bacterium]